MNRRELFKRLTGSIAAAGLASPIEAREVDLVGAPTNSFVVIRFNDRLTQNQKVRIFHVWKDGVKATAWEKVPCLVLDGGAQLEVHHSEMVRTAGDTERGSRYCPVHGWHMFGPTCEAGH